MTKRQAGQVFLEIGLRTYWSHTTGGGGEAFDAVVVRDEEGFPALSGRHVRGIFREASRRVEAWGRTEDYWPPELAGGPNSLTALMFGARNDLRAPSGCLDFPDAFRLHPSLLAGLKTQGLEVFFCGLASTRIEWETGAAFDKSLRQAEAAVPCVLGGWIKWDPSEHLLTAPEDRELVELAGSKWIEHLKNTACVLRAFGSKRTRGFGRARVRVHEVEIKGADQGAAS